MNWVPSLMSWQFAAGGIMAAAVPILLHLLNRRRPRIVHWAAMQFVREALRRQQRLLQLRNVMLLAVRVLAVMLLGLALARPYFAAPRHRPGNGSPLHAVLLVDNSLSMNYQAPDGTLLDRARRRALEYLSTLPVGSRVSVIPACGTVQLAEAQRGVTSSQARELLKSLRTVDAGLDLIAAAREAREACRAVPRLQQRILLFTDRQLNDWRDPAAVQSLGDLPSLQLVDVSEPKPWNASVAAVRLQGDLADTQTPATIVVQLGYHGANEPRDVQLTLSVSDRPVATRTVRLEPDEPLRQVTFQHVFRADRVPPGGPALVPVSAALTPDSLPDDDRRDLIVPVGQSMPVVFVDQYGSEREDRLAGRLGETRHLRALLAPTLSAAQTGKPLLEVRHVSVDRLNPEVLAGARLVVMAGVSDPRDAVPLLHRHVVEGGRLVIAAGGAFDPASWNREAWRDGRGILPAPLGERRVSAGETHGEAGAPYFLLDPESMRDHALFQLAGNSPAQLRDLYVEPVFFQAIRVETTAVDSRAADSATNKQDQPASDGNAPQPPPFETPRVLGRYAVPTRDPFLVERRMGQGNVLFVSTGLSSDWSTLPFTNTFVLFDALVRREIRATLPRLEYPASGRIEIALPDDPPDLLVQLTRPQAEGIEYLDAGFLGPTRRGAVIERAVRRGIYRVRLDSPSPGRAATELPGWEMLVNVAGNASESDLTEVPAEQLAAYAKDFGLQWIQADQPIGLAGSGVYGERLWQWFLAGVLGLLLLEMLVVVRLNRAVSAAPAASFQGAAGFERGNSARAIRSSRRPHGDSPPPLVEVTR